MLAYHNVAHLLSYNSRKKTQKCIRCFKRRNSGINFASKNNEIINTWRLEISVLRELYIFSHFCPFFFSKKRTIMIISRKEIYVFFFPQFPAFHFIIHIRETRGVCFSVKNKKKLLYPIWNFYFIFRAARCGLLRCAANSFFNWQIYSSRSVVHVRVRRNVSRVAQHDTRITYYDFTSATHAYDTLDDILAARNVGR